LRSREFHGQPADASIEISGLSERVDLYCSDGTTPLPACDIPLHWALREGEVRDAEIVIAPHGMPQRLVSCTGRRMLAPSGPCSARWWRCATSPSSATPSCGCATASSATR